LNLAGQQIEGEKEFEKLWKEGKFQDWENSAASKQGDSSEGIWCSACMYALIWLYVPLLMR